MASDESRLVLGSYEYTAPAYIFVNKSAEAEGVKPLTVAVNASDMEYITVVFPTETAQNNFKKDQNLGQDRRPPIPGSEVKQSTVQTSNKQPKARGSMKQSGKGMMSQSQGSNKQSKASDSKN